LTYILLCGKKTDVIELLLEEAMKKSLNVLAGKRCYLSGAIENDQSGHNWRIEPSKVLVEQFKVNLFDPFADPKQQWVPLLNQARQDKDFNTMAKIAKSFVRKDLKLVDKADFLVAYLPYKVATTGTIHEIINSNNAKNPTLLVCPQNKEFIPLWLYGFISHEFMFGSWEALWEYLTEVNEGKHMDNDRWSFVYGLI
jgi:hypothetical protein